MKSCNKENTDGYITLLVNSGEKETSLSKTVGAFYTFLTVSIFVLSLLLTCEKLLIIEIPKYAFVATFLLSLFFTSVFALSQKYVKAIAILLPFLAVVYSCVVSYQRLFNGLLMIIENTIERYNSFFYTDFILIIKPFAIPIGEYNTDGVVFLLVLFLCFIFSYLVSKGKGIFTALIIFLLAFWANTNLTRNVNYVEIIIMAIGLFMVFSSNAGFKNDGIAKNGTIAILLSVGALICAIFFGVSSIKNGYVAPFERYGHDPYKLFEKLNITELFNFNASSYGVGGGKFSTAGNQKLPTGETHLIVTASELEPIYLRGYVGSKYTQNGWTNFDDEVYEKAEPMFDEFYKNGFTPHTITNGFLNEYDGFSDIDFPQVTYTIENMGANKRYAYVPNGLASDAFSSKYFNKEDFIYDTAINSNSLTSHIYEMKKYYPIPITTGEMAKKPAFEQAYEEHFITNPTNSTKTVYDYESFVKQNYLDLPQNSLSRLKADANRLLETAKQTKQWEIEGKRAQICSKLVREFLHSHAVYDLMPGATPKEKDFIEYFLYENHKGYCVHFATAATLMLREMGVPARYVEGYVLSAGDIDKGEILGNGEKTVKIPDRNAHAWTEVWNYGGDNSKLNGWVDVDFTPGFTDTTIAPIQTNVDVPQQMLEAENAVSSQAPSSEIAVSEQSSEMASSKNPSSESASSESSKDLQADESLSNNDEKPLSLFAKIMIVSIFAFVFVCACFVVARKIALKRRTVGFSLEDKNLSFRNIYTYSIKLLNFISLSATQNEDEEVFAKKVQSNAILQNAYGENGFCEFTKKALEAKFSPHSIKAEENEIAKAQVNLLAKNIYNSCGIYKKLKFLYINHL